MTNDLIFINHGKPLDIYSFQGTREMIFWAKEELSEKIVSKIKKICPKILLGSFVWSFDILGNYLYYDEDEIMLYYMKKMKLGFDLDNSALEKIYDSFAADIENFAVEVNKITPLYLFIGIDRINGSNRDKMSIKRVNEILEKISAEKGKSPAKDSLLKLALELLNQRHDIDKKSKDEIQKMLK